MPSLPVIVLKQAVRYLPVTFRGVAELFSRRDEDSPSVEKQGRMGENFDDARYVDRLQDGGEGSGG